jgi:DNA segregation ATPase FtsK/SpoIIIE, S-DNA-T family
MGLYYGYSGRSSSLDPLFFLTSWDIMIFTMSKKHRKRMKSKRAFRLKLKPRTAYSIAQVLFLLLAGLILVSFARQGRALIVINDLLMEYFSWTTVFLPFIFLAIGLYLSKFRFPLSQPNVVIGAMVLFLSLITLSRAGKMGVLAWTGVSELISAPGAFIVLSGTLLVGMIILFNTSLDEFIKFFMSIIHAIKRYIFGDKSFSKGGFQRKELKVLGGSPMPSNPVINKGNSKPVPGPALDALAPQLVSNIPGEEKMWKYPDINLLSDSETGKADRGDIKDNAAIIESTLESFGIRASVVEVNLGPAVTQYAIDVALGTKLSKITSLEKDLARALSAPNGTIRIEAPIPGRNLVGIELPNRAPEFVSFKRMMLSDEMHNAKSKLVVALGLDVSGKPIMADIGKMPHVLIAGQTGSGKSVCINTFLSTLLYRARPSEVKLILVDPKRVELTNYNNIPHLLTPVIVDPPKVVSALRWILSEMDRRYKLFAEMGVRNIDSYNESSGFQALPYIILVIDELADIMLFAPVEVEDHITRIAQMSRATGIHMVLATQRPSVDVITGLIKANIPCRIAFAVASQIDSRVILDTQGAEKLLGRGDMLYLPPEQAKPMRIQGAYISEKETNGLTSFLKNQGVTPEFTDDLTSTPKPGTTTVIGLDGVIDPFFADAVRVVVQFERASASLLQRRLGVGYARAAKIIDQMQEAGVVSAPEGGSKARQVLIQNADEYLNSSVKGAPTMN